MKNFGSNLGILMVSETKIDDTFLESEFLIEDFSTLNRLDWTAMRREFCSTYDRIYHLNISKNHSERNIRRIFL